MTYDELLRKYEPKVAAAFIACMREISSNVILKNVIDALKMGDITAAIKYIQMDPSAFNVLELALQEAFNAGGADLVQGLPQLIDPEGMRVLFQFGARNLDAELALRTLSSSMVTAITEESRAALRIALEAGLSDGRNPTETALDVVGRINPVTGRREGGVIGLTTRQVETVEKVRAGLRSGDVAAMKHYLTLKTRDKRFDRTVLKAIREGKALPAEKQADILRTLNNINLKRRGDLVARTETMQALGTSRDVAMQQQIDAGKVQEENVTKQWHSAGDNDVRYSHRALNRTKVKKSEPFVTPRQVIIRYPGDPQAPLKETALCRCWCEYKIDYTAEGLRKYRGRTFKAEEL